MITHELNSISFIDPENEILTKLAEKIKEIEIEPDEDGDFYHHFKIELEIDDVHSFDFVGKLSYSECERIGNKYFIELRLGTCCYINGDICEKFFINGTEDVNLDNKITELVNNKP